MSLLMKALEQAAKDQSESRGSSPSVAPEAPEPRREPSPPLELLPDDTSPARERTDATPSARPARPDGSGTAARDPASTRTVMSAGTRVNARIAGHRQLNPVIVLGALAALVAAGYAAYVYVQVNHPVALARQHRSTAPPAPAASSGPPTTPTALPAESPATETLTSPLASTAATPQPAPQPLEPRNATANHTVSAPSPPASPPMASETPANRITISHGAADATLNPLLVEAYDALQAGDVNTAQRLYTQLTGSEPGNVDAWLGLAAVASQQGKTEDATRHYFRILELDPRHALAQSGLIGLLGRGDPLGAETRLKQLIARDPSAFLFFTLGNLYADQSLWAQAQQAYFQAHHLEPGNPDHAYNLAVALEHLEQSRLALDFYRKAVGLVAIHGHANFNAARARERISRLATQVR